MAGMNGTSPEIPSTVDADPYATAGEGGAGPPQPPRAGAVGANPKGNQRGSERRGEVGSACSTEEAGESLVEGRGRQTSASAERHMAGTQRPTPMSQSLRPLARQA